MAYFTVIIFTFISLWNWQEPGPLYSLKTYKVLPLWVPKHNYLKNDLKIYLVTTRTFNIQRDYNSVINPSQWIIALNKVCYKKEKKKAIHFTNVNIELLKLFEIAILRLNICRDEIVEEDKNHKAIFHRMEGD